MKAKYFEVIKSNIDKTKDNLIKKLKKDSLNNRDITSEFQKDKINECLNYIYFIQRKNVLYMYGTQKIDIIKTRLDCTGVHYQYVSNFLVYSNIFGEFNFNSISISEKSPILIYKNKNSLSFKSVKFGNIYNIDEFDDFVFMFEQMFVVDRFKRKYKIAVINNGETIFLKDNIDYYDIGNNFCFICEQEKTNEIIFYSLINKTENKINYLRNIHQINKLSEIELTKYIKLESQDNKIKLIFTMGDSIGANILYRFGKENGNMNILHNIIPYDATLCYYFEFEKTDLSKIKFVFNMIGKYQELQFKILGVRMQELLDYIFDKKVKNQVLCENVYEELTILLNIHNKTSLIYELKKYYGDFSLLSHDEQYSVLIGEKIIDNMYIPKFGEKYFPNSIINSKSISILRNSIIGEKWKSEFCLFLLVRSYYGDAVFHYTDKWLGLQHLDIFIPSIYIAIEYQGKQHYENIDYFGMDLKTRQYLDGIKKEKCLNKKIKLIEWSYETKVIEINFLIEIRKAGIIELPKPNKEERWNFDLNKESEYEKPIIKKTIRKYSKDGMFLEEYNNISDASNLTGISCTSIRRMLNGKNKTAGGYIWSEDYSDSEIKSIEIKIENINNNKPVKVMQVDAETGEIVGEYDSMKQAERITGINQKSISDVLRGKQNRAGGYLWVKK